MKKFWIFAGLIIFLAGAAWGQGRYRWLGGPGNWGDNNWEDMDNPTIPPTPSGTIPGGSDYAEINSGTVTLTQNITLGSLGINIGLLTNGGTVSLGSYSLTATAITNNGTITLDGVSATQIGPHTTMGGTVEFTGSGTTLAGIENFYNLTIQGGTRTATSDVVVSGTANISAGSLNMATHNLNAVNLAITGTLTAGPEINVTGIWNRTGPFNAGSGLVRFTGATVNGANTFNTVICTGNVVFQGSNTIANLTCSPGANVSFASGAAFTQTIAYLTATGASLNRSGTAGHWNLVGLTEGNFITNSSASSINWCNSANFLNRTTATGTNQASGSDNIRVFAGGTFTWTGTANTAWTNDANWDTGWAPPATDVAAIIVIPTPTDPEAPPPQPVLGSNVQCGSLTIQSGATINLGNNNLSTGASGLINSGTIMLHGTAGQVTVGGTAPAGIGGTIHYYNNPSSASWVFGVTYTNLIIANNVTMSSASNLNINGTANIGSEINADSIIVFGLATISANITTTDNQEYRGSITLSGSPTFTSSGGEFLAREQVSGTGITVNASQGITINNTYNDLSGIVVLNNDQTGDIPDNAVNFLTTAAVTVSGVNPAGSFTVNAGGNLTVGASGIDAEEIITLSGDANINVNANITSDTDINLTSANGSVLKNEAASLHASSLIVNADEDIILGGMGGSTHAPNNIINSVELNANDGYIVFLNNTTQTLSLTAHGPEISIRNTGGAALNITALTGEDIQIDNDGNINANSVLNISDAAIRLISGDNITIGQAITAYSLALIAGGSPTPAGTVAINAAISAGSDEEEGSNAAVYIQAGTITGNGAITLRNTDGAVCANIAYLISYTGEVTDNRIHYHAPSGRHIVYRSGEVDPVTRDFSGVDVITGVNTTDPIPANSYLYIQAELPLGANRSFSTTGNIYLIDVGNVTNANTRSLILNAGGYIEIRGVYQSSGTLSFESNGNTIRLVNSEANHNNQAVITLPSLDFTGQTLNVRGVTNAAGNTASIITTAAGITLGNITSRLPGINDLTLSSGANPITMDGNIGSTTNWLGNITVVTTDTATFSGITHANSYTQQNTGTAIFTGPQTFYGTNAGYSFQFDGTSLAINNMITARGAFTQTAGTVSAGVPATTPPPPSIISGVTISSGGDPITVPAIHFESPLTLTGAVTLNTSAVAGDIDLRAVSASAAGNLNIQNGNGVVTLNDTVEVNGQLTQTGSGIVNIYEDIKTTSTGAASSSISFQGQLRLQSNDLIISSTAGTGTGTRNISFNTIDRPGYNLTVDAGTGNITFDGIVGTDVANQLGTITLNNGTTTTAQGIVNIDANIFADLVEFNGGENQKVQSGDNAYLGNVQINDGTTLTITGNVRQRDGSTLTIGEGTSGILNTVGTSWWALGGIGTVANSTMQLINGELIFMADSQLHTSGFVLPDTSNYTVRFNAPAEIWATGAVNIQSIDRIDLFTNQELRDFTLVMNGIGTSTSPQNLQTGTNAAIGSLRIETGGNDYVAIVGNIEIRGDVHIKSGNLRGPSGNRIRVTGYYNLSSPSDKANRGAKWYQTADLNTVTGPGGYFARNNSTVEFGDPTVSSGVGRTFRIAGNTDWHILACHEPSADMLFSNYGTPGNTHTHIVNNKFEVEPRRIDIATSDLILDPAPASMILLGRLTNPPSFDPVTNPIPIGGEDFYIPPTAPNNDFWYFNLATGGELELNFVFIHYSYSMRRIPFLVGDRLIHLVIATPYLNMVSGQQELGNPRTQTIDNSFNFSFYNVNWFVENYFYYSFTEDSNGNGRIDRIRAQAAFEVMHEDDVFLDEDGNWVRAFERFDVEVEGYSINRDEGYNGFERVPGAEDCIYIYLVEKPYLDSTARPRWRVTRNDSLKDATTKSIFVGEERVSIDDPANGWHNTWNTVPPRIAYALALPLSAPSPAPEQYQIFFQMSKPVAPGISADIIGTTDLTLTPVNPGSGEYLIEGSPGYTIQQLTTVPSSHFFTLSNVRDNEPWVLDRRSRPVDPANPITYYNYRYPSPKYPTTWEYTTYIEIRGWYEAPGSTNNRSFVEVPSGASPPPSSVRNWDQDTPNNTGNRMLGFTATPGEISHGSGRHRVSDLLISIPPREIADDTYFVWPIWARNQQITDPDADLELGDWTTLPGYGYMPYDPGITETNIIWDFTGRRFLERDDILMQSRVNSSFGAPTIYFGFNIDDSNRTAAGLWSPQNEAASNPPYINLFPTEILSGMGTGSPLSSAPPLYTYLFSQPPGNVTVEFYYQLGGTPVDLFAARLDILPESAIPEDWYRYVRPFTFEIHDITRQRGGVTILNNVINSNNREHVFIDYRPTGPGRVTIQVFTLDGNLVKILKRDGNFNPNEYNRVSWDGTNQGGRPVARGMYFVRVVGPGIDEIRKVMVVR